MRPIASQIIDGSAVYSTVCSGADQRKSQSSASLAFVRGIHRWPVNSPHKGPVSRKVFPFDDVIMSCDRDNYRSSAWTLGRYQQIQCFHVICLLFCSVLSGFINCSCGIDIIHLPIFIRVASLALWNSYDVDTIKNLNLIALIANKATLKDMGKIDLWQTSIKHNHWNGYVILTKFLSTAALEVVKMTTSSTASDENFVKMIFSFRWLTVNYVRCITFSARRATLNYAVTVWDK